MAVDTGATVERSVERTVRRQRRRRGFTVLAGVLAVFVTLLVLYPLGSTVLRIAASEQGIGGAVRDALAQPNLLNVLANTGIIVVSSVFFATIVGSGFAWLSERSDASIGWVTRMLPIIPLLIPPIAGSVGWIVLGAPVSGYVNVFLRWVASWFGVEMTEGPLTIHSWYGMIFVYTLYLVPLIFMTVAAALRNVDPALEEAARASGARPSKAARTVTIPSVKPAIGAGILLAIIYAFSLYSIPVALGRSAGIEVISVRIVSLMRVYPPNPGTAMALGVVVMVVIGIGLWLQRRLLRNNRFATISGRSARPMLVQLGIWKWPARAAMVGYVLLTAVLPVVGLLIVSTQPFWSASINWAATSLDRYVEMFTTSTAAGPALRNSVMIGAIGATLAMLIAAIVSAYSDRRMHSLIGRSTDFSTKLPGAVSNILIGIAFVAAFAGPPFRIGGTLLILLLAYLVITMPQASFTASAAYAQVGRDLEEASLSCGASEGRTFARVVLPLMIPGLTAGWAMVFVLMAGDITASAMLAGPGNPVVGAYMLDMVNFGNYGLLTTIATALVLVSTIVVFLFLRLSRGIGVGRLRSKSAAVEAMAADQTTAVGSS